MLLNNDSKLILWCAGKILTIETLPVRLTSPDGKRPVVDADQTCYLEDNASHVLYMTRIFYCYGTVHEEVIGSNNCIRFTRPTAVVYCSHVLICSVVAYSGLKWGKCKNEKNYYTH